MKGLCPSIDKTNNDTSADQTIKETSRSHKSFWWLIHGMFSCARYLWIVHQSYANVCPQILNNKIYPNFRGVVNWLWFLVMADIQYGHHLVKIQDIHLILLKFYCSVYSWTVHMRAECEPARSISVCSKIPLKIT